MQSFAGVRGVPENFFLIFLPPQAASQNQLEEPYEFSNTPLVKYRHTGTPDYSRHRSLPMAATRHQLKLTNYSTSHSNTSITMHRIKQINPTAVDNNEPRPGLDTQHKPHRHLRRIGAKLVSC